MLGNRLYSTKPIILFIVVVVVVITIVVVLVLLFIIIIASIITRIIGVITSRSRGLGYWHRQC
jgi:hypothetical protein